MSVPIKRMELKPVLLRWLCPKVYYVFKFQVGFSYKIYKSFCFLLYGIVFDFN